MSSRTEEYKGEGGSLAEVAGVAMLAWAIHRLVSGKNIGIAGAVVAGVAVLAWGRHNLLSAEDIAIAGALVAGVAMLASKIYQLLSDKYTLHYSGSDINQLQYGGAGCIIRNKQGKLVIAATYNLNHLCSDQYDIAVAEAIAWSKGLKLAEINRIKLDRVVGDNVEVINRVLGIERKAPKVPLLSETVGDIRVALQEHSIDPMTQVERIRREDNKVANELASLGSKLGGLCLERSYGVDGVLPFKLAQLIREDEINFRGKNLLM